MCYLLWYVLERRDAHEPAESTQLPLPFPNTEPMLSPPPTPIVFVLPQHIWATLPLVVQLGSQDHAGTRLSGGARVFALASDKITRRHREREAYVYVRQSTLKQVQQNQES
jgi:hypothetical protein